MARNIQSATDPDHPSALRLGQGSRIAVIGSGPAGSFFAYFLLDGAQRIGVDLHVDIFEPRDFSGTGPASCNMCGGIISESLVQALAAEGIVLPPTVVQRGIDAYVLHVDGGRVRIDTPLGEKRIAAVHRAAGPKGARETRWRSFDGHLLDLARSRGASRVRERVSRVRFENGRPVVETRDGTSGTYDLLAVASGINAATAKLFEESGLRYQPPKTTRTYISEFYLGERAVDEQLGDSMHVFLLDIPRLEFAALIPKGDYVTLCLLGREIDEPLVQRFLDDPEVRQCLPPDWRAPERFCHCSPGISVGAARGFFDDRVVFIGDCGVTRLYKDGIGAAYRTAKAAARTAVFEGISARDFRRHYGRACRRIAVDNALGRFVFGVTGLIRKLSLPRRGLLRMVSWEQGQDGVPKRLSMVLWDTFTGSAPYANVLKRTLHPSFIVRFLWNIAAGIGSRGERACVEDTKMGTGELGKLFRDGEVIVREDEPGDCMYVVQEGRVEVVRGNGGGELRLAMLGQGEFFGEMALFERERRSATVRALGDARVLTVDKRTFLGRIAEDPSLAFRMVELMSRRLRDLDGEMMRLRSEKPAS